MLTRFSHMSKSSVCGLVCFAFLLSVGATASAAQKHDMQETNQRTREIMHTWYETYQLPSLSMAVSINGEIVFAEALGFADVEKKRRATPETLYSVGSMAKPMTGIALARLISDGTLSLDKGVNDYLHFEPSKGSDITLRQLASHTGGIGRPWSARNELEFGNPKDHVSPMEVLPIFSDKTLDFKPGSGFQYSSMGYVLLSALIEKASGKLFTAYMAENVWGPLAMHNTALDDSKVDARREAQYYKQVDEKGHYELAEQNATEVICLAGGGFVSTPSDLVRMADVWSQPETVDVSVLEQMMEPVKLDNGEVNEQHYALGWRVGSMHLNGKDSKVIHHGGVTWQAATGFVLIVPEYRAALAYVTNMSPKSFGSVRSQTGDILKAYIK